MIIVYTQMGDGFWCFNNYVLEGTFSKKCREGNLGTLHCLHSVLLCFMQYLQIQLQFRMSYVDSNF